MLLQSGALSPREVFNFMAVIFEKILKRYHYPLPLELIAEKPASPRDKARLLIYETLTGKITEDQFLNLDRHLPPKAVVVFNQTRVIPARLFPRKETGGRVEILFIEKTQNEIKVMANQKLNLGAKLFLTKEFFFAVKAQEEKYYYLTPSFSWERWEEILERYGRPPIPPYLRHTRLSQKLLKEKYQSVFARKKGAIAAPTASLHFTNRLLNRLKRRGVKIYFITLHVGLGTFLPVTEEQWRHRRLHREFYEIDPKTADFLNYAKRRGKPIIAVGTTTLRALESASDRFGELRKLNGWTSLFIRDNYKFKFTRHLITNFHVPQSSLLMLLDALLGRTALWRIYRHALKQKFRFLSFGDGLLLLGNHD